MMKWPHKLGRLVFWDTVETQFKLIQHHCHHDLKKFTRNFTNRVISIGL